MAKLRIYKDINNLVYNVTLELKAEEISEGDKLLMQKFGEPEIDLGGTFLANTANEYTLPSNLIRIKSDLPITIRFDSRDEQFETNTVTKVDAFISATTTKFNSAFTTLRNNGDGYTGEQIVNI